MAEVRLGQPAHRGKLRRAWYGRKTPRASRCLHAEDAISVPAVVDRGGHRNGGRVCPHAAHLAEPDRQHRPEPEREPNCQLPRTHGSGRARGNVAAIGRRRDGRPEPSGGVHDPARPWPGSGRVTIDGDEIEFHGSDLCEGSGIYTWVVEGDTLTFTMVGTDPCSGRSEVLVPGSFGATCPSLRIRRAIRYEATARATDGGSQIPRSASASRNIARSASSASRVSAAIPRLPARTAYADGSCRNGGGTGRRRLGASAAREGAGRR